ncbi:MAG: hypothetical protein WBV94_09395 [Blastocatellia bacterium]
MSSQAKKRSGAPVGNRRLYSVPVWMEQRAFAGGFDLAGASYKLAFVVSRAEVANKQLRLHGRLTVTDPRGRARSVDSAQATIAAIQGGIGSAPLRRRITAQQTGNVVTAQQKQQMAGENEKREGQKTEEPARPAAGDLPRTESTGPTSFCGVMYMHMEPLDPLMLGVAADLSRVQLNARFAPQESTAKTLHSLYTALVDAVYGEQPDEAEGAALVAEMNKVLKG